MCIFNIQEEIKPRVDKIAAAIWDKYGADERFAHAEGDTMKLLLQELRRRLTFPK